MHSVETWREGRLVGGLYGVSIGGLFAGESMFHHETDASKAALVGLVELLDDGEDRLVDTQWLTPHLASLGVREMAREDVPAAAARAPRGAAAAVAAAGRPLRPDPRCDVAG